MTCPALVREKYAKMARMVRRRRAFIFNYFDHRYANAFTEMSNRRIKQMLRAGNGYKFETVRPKLLFGQEGMVEDLPTPNHTVRVKGSQRGMVATFCTPLAYYKQLMSKRIETVFSQITMMMPRHIHAVSFRGFLLKVSLFVIAFVLQRRSSAHLSRWNK